MFLTIAGKLGSGKSTVCKILEEQDGYTIYSTGKVQRKLAKEMGITTLELNEWMRNKPGYDHVIDDEVVKISKESAGEKIVFDSRMAFHFVEKSFDIFMIIDPMEAANRVMLDSRGSVESYKDNKEARDKLLERAEVENSRFKDIYKVNNFDYNNYNLIVDTTWCPAVDVAEIIRENADDSAQGLKIFISPKTLCPTLSFEEAMTDGAEQIEICIKNHYHYVVKGHKLLLNALESGEKFVNVKLSESEITNTLEVEELRKYESFGGFTYKSKF